MMSGASAAPRGWACGATAWLTAARWLAAMGWLLWIAMQVIAADPFPPEVSLSQYGLGGAGFVFSLWAIGLGLAPLLLLRYRPVAGPALPLAWTALAGAVVTALVRTDEGGLQLSLAAEVHQVAAVVALVLLPLGVMFAMLKTDRQWRRIAIGITVATAVMGALVLLSAAGVDTTGGGAPASWAFWQGSLGVLEMLLVSLYAVAVTTIDPHLARRETVPPVPSPGQ